MKFKNYKRENVRINYKENTRFLIIFNYIKRNYPDIAIKYNAIKYNEENHYRKKSEVLLELCENYRPNLSQEILAYVRKRRSDEVKRNKINSDDFKKRHKDKIKKLHEDIRTRMGL